MLYRSIRQRLQPANNRRRMFHPSVDLVEARVLLTTLLVTNTDDAGRGSLRDAIFNAASGDTIAFQIPAGNGTNYNPASNSWTILLNSPLSIVQQTSLTIDGLSQQAQPGATTTHPVVELAPSANYTGGGAAALSISTDGNSVTGLVIDGFQGDGIDVFGGSTLGNSIIGNYIGTDPTGTQNRGNTGHGVLVTTSKNTVRGNLISGQGFSGVFIDGSGANANLVAGNLIGTDAGGTVAIPNRQGGILANSGATQNTIGGTAADGNVISGNIGDGVQISNGLGFGSALNLVIGNFIGVARGGGATLPNSGNGVNIDEVNGNQIGGIDSSLGNVIANNGAAGVLISRPTDGNTALGNAILSNSIFANATGIVLRNGGNHGQAAPILSAAVALSGSTLVQGTFTVRAGAQYIVQYFANIPAGSQGRTLLGSQTFGTQTADTTIPLTFSTSEVPAGATITAIASVTSTPGEPSGVTSGDTSAFSQPVVVASPFVVTNTGDQGLGSLRFAIQQANLDVDRDDTITFRIPTADPGFNASTGSWTISVPSPLLIFKPASRTGQHAVVIDALSQQGQPGAANSHPVITLTPSSDFNGDGLTVGTPGNTIRGLDINRFGGSGLVLQPSAGGNLLTGNSFGTDATGASALGNGGNGLTVLSSSNTIGGLAAGSQNLLSGNSGYGLVLSRSTAATNLVLGNRIGTDATGTIALPNGLGGIAIQAGSNNTILANLVSGNSSNGITLTDGAPSIAITSVEGTEVTLSSETATPAGNTIIGNTIGTTLDGLSTLGNTLDGIGLTNATGTVIDGNLISGNGMGVSAATTAQATAAGDVVVQDAAGINLVGVGSSSNVIRNNLIGTNRSGSGKIGNSLHGIFVGAGAHNNEIGPNNLVSGNGLVTNQGVGIFLDGTSTTANTIFGNTIGTNQAGTASLTDAVIGVLINQAPRNTIRNNLISGQRFIGLEIAGQTASGNVVQANRIGTDRAGQRAVPNGVDGIFINNAPGNLIGGTAPGEGNQISGNGSSGIQLFGANARGNVIVNNAIGQDSAGQLTLRNRTVGIFINTAPQLNQVGGRRAGQANHGQTRVLYTTHYNHSAARKAAAARAKMRAMARRTHPVAHVRKSAKLSVKPQSRPL